MAALPGAALPGAAQIVAALGAWQTDHGASVVVAIDGHGGSGKTTIAGHVAVQLGVVLVHTDDYFRDAGPSGSDRRPMARYYDWERMRAQAILPVLSGGRTAPMLIEGVSSASPALADLVTHAVLVVAPEPVRLARLHERVSDEEWDEEWLAEERRYFGQRPAASFDLVVAGSVV